MKNSRNIMAQSSAAAPAPPPDCLAEEDWDSSVLVMWRRILADGSRATPISYSLSPVIRGEGWGEGMAMREGERRSLSYTYKPLSPALSPAYRGEGACR